MLDGLYMTLEVSMLSLLFATLWGSVICSSFTEPVPGRLLAKIF